MKRIEKMSKDDLLNLYIKSAQGYIDEIRGGTARAANRHQAVGERITKELKRRGAEGEILALLSHPRPAVRLWAAVDALDIEPVSAQRVLEDLDENAIPTIKMYASNALEDLYKDKT